MTLIPLRRAIQSASSVNLGLTAFTILEALSDGPMIASEACAIAQINRANLSQLSITLLKAGFITRSTREKDRRKVMLALTKSGRKALAAVQTSITAKI